MTETTTAGKNKKTKKKENFLFFPLFSFVLTIYQPNKPNDRPLNTNDEYLSDEIKERHGFWIIIKLSRSIILSLWAGYKRFLYSFGIVCACLCRKKISKKKKKTAAIKDACHDYDDQKLFIYLCANCESYSFIHSFSINEKQNRRLFVQLPIVSNSSIFKIKKKISGSLSSFSCMCVCARYELVIKCQKFKKKKKIFPQNNRQKNINRLRKHTHTHK